MQDMPLRVSSRAAAPLRGTLKKGTERAFIKLQASADGAQDILLKSLTVTSKAGIAKCTQSATRA